MNAVPIDLASAPGARLVSNSLIPTTDPAFLDQDLVLVELPAGLFIDVSWYPEHDLAGKYYVTVFRHGEWESPLDEGEAKCAQEAAALVELLAERHSPKLVQPLS
jgi:hypothetical protein